MRLPAHRVNIIKASVIATDPDARIFLFGSRLNDRLKGGDIDVLILSNKMDFSAKNELKYKLLLQMEEQKIDIIIARDRSDPFVNFIYPICVEL
jgi:predicted nucleotidyltransferase